MAQRRMTFVLLSFEGPDRYSHAGGLGSRVRDLSTELAAMGYETHLFFIGDPDLPGVETRENGLLTLHRWCQWISKFHPGGVYDGEEGKVLDWTGSLVPWLARELLTEQIEDGNSVIVLAEEWQTAASVVSLRQVIDRRGWQQRVQLFWNLNNPFGVDRIDWTALKDSAVITTVSRYMKHFLWRFGVDPRVVPNGISESWFDPANESAGASIKRLLEDRMALVKVARWDPDKRWIMTVEAVAALKRQGLRPLLIARGGIERHRDEVLARANALGLEVTSVSLEGGGAEELATAIKPAVLADVINVSGYLHQPQLKTLYHNADAVLANSGIEPFGLVGLEAMASGGLAFVGVTGEDYATPGYDCISIQTDNPDEIAYHASYLKAVPAVSRYVRRFAKQTARRYTWAAVIRRVLMPAIGELGGILAVPEWLQVPRSSTEVEPVTSRTRVSVAAERLPASSYTTTENGPGPREKAGLATA